MKAANKPRCCALASNNLCILRLLLLCLLQVPWTVGFLILPQQQRNVPTTAITGRRIITTRRSESLQSDPDHKIPHPHPQPYASGGGEEQAPTNQYARGEDKKFEYPEYTQHAAIQPAGPLWKQYKGDLDMSPKIGKHRRKRVLVLCTGGTLTMAKDPDQDNALAPVSGALTSYLESMTELQNTDMPEVVAYEYSPLIDSSDMGPGDWAVLASDIGENYFYFDGFVILSGTDTMAYAASALSFMLESLGKPVVVTGSQIPLVEPYNDARRNLIMALIFASRENLHEVTIFFHDRLLRGCRATKVNTSRLMAFDSPNLEPLAHIGITIDENHNIMRQ